MPDDGSGSGIVHGVIFFWIEEWWLQNACREIDGIGLGVFVGIHRGRGHLPLRAIERLADLLQLPIDLEGRGTLHIPEMIITFDFH